MHKLKLTIKPIVIIAILLLPIIGYSEIYFHNSIDSKNLELLSRPDGTDNETNSEESGFNVFTYGEGIVWGVADLIPGALNLLFLATGHDYRFNYFEDMYYKGEPFVASLDYDHGPFETIDLHAWARRARTSYDYWIGKPMQTINDAPEALALLGNELIATCNPIEQGISELESGKRTFNIALILSGITSSARLGVAMENAAARLAGGGGRMLLATTPEGAQVPVLVASGAAEAGAAAAAIGPETFAGLCLMASNGSAGATGGERPQVKKDTTLDDFARSREGVAIDNMVWDELLVHFKKSFRKRFKGFYNQFDDFLSGVVRRNVAQRNISPGGGNLTPKQIRDLQLTPEEITTLRRFQQEASQLKAEKVMIQRKYSELQARGLASQTRDLGGYFEGITPPGLVTRTVEDFTSVIATLLQPARARGLMSLRSIRYFNNPRVTPKIRAAAEGA